MDEVLRELLHATIVNQFTDELELVEEGNRVLLRRPGANDIVWAQWDRPEEREATLKRRARQLRAARGG